MPAESPLCGELRLIETLLWTRSEGFWLLEGHLCRLAKSSWMLGFHHSESRVRNALADATRDCEGERLRVRLLQARDGGLAVTVRPEPLVEPRTWRLVVSPERLQPDDPLLCHKTSSRALYDSERARLCKPTRASGYDEVIFLNTENQVCEGAITSLFADLGSGLLTPPLHCGLLPGVLRDHLLATGQARETVLTLSDLDNASRLFVGNAVRGLLPAVLETARL